MGNSSQTSTNDAILPFEEGRTPPPKWPLKASNWPKIYRQWIKKKGNFQVISNEDGSYMEGLIRPAYIPRGGGKLRRAKFMFGLITPKGEIPRENDGKQPDKKYGYMEWDPSLRDYVQLHKKGAGMTRARLAVKIARFYDNERKRKHASKQLLQMGILDVPESIQSAKLRSSGAAAKSKKRAPAGKSAKLHVFLDGSAAQEPAGKAKFPRLSTKNKLLAAKSGEDKKALQAYRAAKEAGKEELAFLKHVKDSSR